MNAKIVKWGTGFAVRIPKAIAKEASLKAGDFVEIEASGEGAVQLQRLERTPTLAQLVSQITPENRYGAVSSGPELGTEFVEW